jgi:Cd2+/Zn2+-exporting ATPase
VTATTCSVCEIHAESTFKVEGMDCREEVALIERRFKYLHGVEDFEADLMGQRLHVKYDAAKISTAVITAAVADAGMRAWLEHEEPVATGEAGQRLQAALLVVSGLMLAAGLGASVADVPAAAARTLFALSIAAGGPATARRAWHAVRLRSLDINVLMVAAAAGAISLGEWSEAASVVFLFAVAQTLEARTLERARLAVRALMELTPNDALVRDAEGERRVSVDSLTPGAVIVIRPGEKVPLDGEVVTGMSAVNQAPVTGESLPIDKAPGDEVFAGSINGRGALDVRITRFRNDTTLARVIHLVEQAQSRRAPAQVFVDRFARIYTPAVLVLALVLATLPPLLLGAAWETWVYRALVLLVVSCPCALVISTPVSVIAALAGAARRGVLIKGGAHLERVATVRCVAFDKTGTLTRGALEVADVMPLGNASAAAVVSLAAAIERRSDHPIARAVLRHVHLARLPVADAVDVVALAGLGAEGRVDGTRVVVGNHRLFEDRGWCTHAIHAALDDMNAKGRTSVLVALEGRILGIIGLSDEPRETSRETIAALRRQGIEALVMLTGDSTGTARHIAKVVGVDEYHAELLPEDKVSAVADLRRRYGSVAMVGDGVNDAPALASADVGIAMGAAGSDAALETADVALMADELLKIPYALRLSRTTLVNIKINLGVSLVLKGAFVAAAIAGVATLWMAVLADTGASVLVVANALRLLRTD